MAAPETDVPNLLGEKSTPAKLEELSREVGHTFKKFFLLNLRVTKDLRGQ